jgi:hypothetical protein
MIHWARSPTTKSHRGPLINRNIVLNEVSGVRVDHPIEGVKSIFFFVFYFTESRESSSSSENSPSSLSRKLKPTYQTRKSGKSATSIAKRHVRSSSGYSSHNEETTFR